MGTIAVWVVGDDDATADVGPAATHAASREQADLVVAVGADAVVELVRDDVAAPVLPVATDRLDGVAREDVAAALEHVAAGTHRRVSHPVLAVGSPTVRAVFDVALVSAEPARISEYTVHVDDTRVGRFRADGVVVATPAGSTSYSRAAGGPTVHPIASVLAVVPIAPFTVDPARWIVPPDGLALTVVRDETPVELVVDGRSDRAVPAGDPLAIAVADTLETVHPATPERATGASDRSTGGESGF